MDERLGINAEPPHCTLGELLASPAIFPGTPSAEAQRGDGKSRQPRKNHRAHRGAEGDDANSSEVLGRR